jgi:hypothetical protein
MCLTLCHRRGIVYNNHTCDVCRECSHRLGGAGRCGDCRHYAGDDVCDLTKARVPRWRRCCHWNVERDERIVRGDSATESPVIPLDAVDPLLLERAYRGDATLFAEEWGMDPEGIPAAEIAVPLVYGVESAEWAEAMGQAGGEGRGASCGIGNRS